MFINSNDYFFAHLQLIDVYVEAYQHVFDMHERRLLAQVIVNLMYRRPRYDFNGDYFITTYKAECRALRLHCKLVKSILDQQVSQKILKISYLAVIAMETCRISIMSVEEAVT